LLLRFSVRSFQTGQEDRIVQPSVIAVLTVLLSVTLGVYALAGIAAFGPRSAALGPPQDFGKHEPKTKKGIAVRSAMIALQMTAILALIWLVMKSDVGVTAYGWLIGFSCVFMTAFVLQVIPLPFRPHSGLAYATRFALAMAIVLPAFVFRSWLTIDIAAMAMAVGVLVQFRSVGLKFCVAVLCGIMLYDVVAVFGTKMMLDVAGQVTKPGHELPILFILPSSFGLGATKAAILGLGDVVLPGVIVMVGFREAKRLGARSLAIGPVVGYVLGMIATVAVLLLTKAGQPATIYLVPGVIGGLLIPAWAKGLLREVFATPVPEKSDSSEAEAA
jgi:presenilin-like A22 family membrane protease